MIPQSYIDEVLARVNIIDIIDARVRLKKAGKNNIACCPFHDEKTPSFTVTESEQFYYCFGCGKSGNAIGFIMDYERLDFKDAVVILGRSLGLGDPSPETIAKESMQARYGKYRRLRSQIVDDNLLIEIVKAARIRGEQILDEEKPKISAAIERLKKNREEIKMYADVVEAIKQEQVRQHLVDAHMTAICHELQHDGHLYPPTQRIPRKVATVSDGQLAAAQEAIKKLSRAI